MVRNKRNVIKENDRSRFSYILQEYISDMIDMTIIFFLRSQDNKEIWKYDKQNPNINATVSYSNSF